jgi:hypothetical protein
MIRFSEDFSPQEKLKKTAPTIPLVKKSKNITQLKSTQQKVKS